MAIPESLRYKMSQFIHSGRIVRTGQDLFVTPNWLAVLTGQGIWPEHYDPLTDQLDPGELRRYLGEVRETIRRQALAAPRHEDYIAQNCRAEQPATAADR